MRVLSVPAILIVAMLAGCGGSSPDATPTPRPTRTPNAYISVPTSTPGPTLTPSPSPAPSPTLAQVQSTATMRPATVVAPSRAVATRAPTAIPVEAATVTPTPASGTDFVLEVDESFDESTQLFLGETQYGTSTMLSSGSYGMIVPEKAWQNIIIDWVPELGDGTISALIELEGEGAAGLVARSNTSADGTFNFYLCWLSSDQAAGCHVSLNSEWVELFRTESGAVAVQTANEVLLYVVGDQLSFEVNGVEIGTANESTLLSGEWGLYAESYAGEFTAWFEHLSLYRLVE